MRSVRSIALSLAAAAWWMASPAAADGIARHAFEWHRRDDGGWILALTVEPEPGWHVYWENPGDSGDAPRIELELPAGLEAGPTVYPRPMAEMLDGSVFYGYSGRVSYLVPVSVRAPAPEAAGSPGAAPAPSAGARWKVTARVMACKERCTITAAGAEGSWPPKPAPGPAPALEGGSVHGASLPMSAAKAGVEARISGGRVRIEGPAHGAASVRFIPANVPGMEVPLPDGAAAIAGAVKDGRFLLEFPLAAPGEGPGRPAVAGLVLLGNRPGDPCVRLAVPPAAPASGAPPAANPRSAP